uniref:Uncharacterized protein n=1 Tax=Dunaliella tertiolecta TaxID=3047 RepID=A0A7S3VRW3_DUNTE|mmetsp:Transcript_5391/g.14541  ORF Transcript_5391/g.14541 Transcript_5391/m.14541 type:complete len:107 (-) Transcript_5391:733-1053(-)|eukprot:CAMPEP_0202371626 /NCGR_PEP_ID=MMETSP1127-20130417/2988_1 /ASSEMBLY_ACC=CAM_ASM_000462 /TAXON_ID=3047 /ORGANISM="Dunaliella tertiolecta, Strain CCMP1320" /LENGTH=106 /DNA_ID=CAMNT_0048967943 /DNA_START=120 /DNA_END=440 /DNA_ORIENTATION=-
MNEEHQFHRYVTGQEGPRPSRKSLKFSFSPDFRLPPGVKGSRIALSVLAALGISAIPIWGLPYISGSQQAMSKEEQEQKELVFMYAKKRNREKRMEWIHSDEMPYK